MYTIWDTILDDLTKAHQRDKENSCLLFTNSSSEIQSDLFGSCKLVVPAAGGSAHPPGCYNVLLLTLCDAQKAFHMHRRGTCTRRRGTCSHSQTSSEVKSISPLTNFPDLCNPDKICLLFFDATETPRFAQIIYSYIAEDLTQN